MSVNPRVWPNRHWWACLLFAPGLALAAPFAYVGSGTNISVVDTATNSIVATVPVGFGSVGIALNSAGTRVYVTRPFSNSVTVVDATANTVIAAMPVGSGPLGIAVDATGTRIYVAISGTNTVSVLDATSYAVVAAVAVGAYPDGVAVNPTASRVYVTNNKSDSVSAIDTATNTVVATVPVGSGPTGVAVNPAGTRVYVTNNKSDSVSTIDTATNIVVGTVPVGSGPVGVAVNPAGTRVYVSNPDSNNVSVIDTTTNTVVATVAVGTTPSGIAVTPDGSRAYVINVDSDNISVIDTASNTIVATFAVPLPLAFGQFIGPESASEPNYQGLWWATGGTESGWGINFAHQGDQVFATWYTYDTTGKAWWLSMLANRTTGNTYSGPIYVDSGPPFNNFVGAGMPTQVGNGTLTFTDANNGSFDLHGATGTIAEQGDQPLRPRHRTAADLHLQRDHANLAVATNYQDLWWVAEGAESGWGINFAHQGDSVFATWYTYDVDGAPLWLSALTPPVVRPTSTRGRCCRTSGPRFDTTKQARWCSRFRWSARRP